MKVVENGTDRRAEVHLRADGVLQELCEYGQYIDKDGAVCCYVALEEDQVISLAGKFNGTVHLPLRDLHTSNGSQTLKIAYDVVVDGTLRASNFYLAKAVTCLKGRKFGFDNFLYQKGKGILETAMKVSLADPGLATKGEGQETLGTVEVRLYVLRRFGEEHDIEGLRIYDDTEEKAENNDSDQKKDATYNIIEPDLTMVFEEDCVSLGTKGMKAQRSKVSKPRPGKAPWAVFRFHYRTKGKYHQVPHGREPELTKYRSDRGQ
jgi:hypothetical protein